jgi:predicted Zn finger-like uncharacterized protein
LHPKGKTVVVQCPACESKYKYPEERFEGKPSKKVKCPSCGNAFEVANPAFGGKEKSTGNISSKTQRVGDKKLPSGKDLSPEDAALHGIPLLPPDRKLSLSILDGNLSGTVFPVEKPVVTIGRSNADLILNDPEASRLHAQLEVQGYKYVLKDMESTNGVFVGEKRVKEAVLENLSEFRIGSTTLMFIETRLDE